MTGFGALQGLRVLDLTQALAGPFCTQILADHGADVVKIEPLVSGDMARASGPFHPADHEQIQSGYFHSINRNKRSISLDLKSDDGRRIFLAMLPAFDVVVENFRAGVMERLGLKYESLSRMHPRLVYAAIRGFGDPRTGASPYVDWPAYDIVAQAMGGMVGITGPDVAHPTKVGPGVGDTIPALYATIGILAAVLRARETNKGQFVDVAMVDAILGVTERIVYQRSFANCNAVPEGNHHPFIVPFGIFAARDGNVAIACPDDRFFMALCQALDASHLADRFPTREIRRTNRFQVIDSIETLTRTFSTAQLLERLGGKLPFGPIYGMDEIATDPHFSAREMLVDIQCPGISEPLQIAGVPIKFSETPGRVVRQGPQKGEHTDEVLMEAGFSISQIQDWRRNGIIT